MNQDRKVTTETVSISSKDDQNSNNPTQNVSSFQNASDLEKRLVRKIDYHLLIWSFFGYFANGLDRNNMPNAYTNGMDVDLDLESEKYNWAVLMFFIGYMVLQIPSNAIIARVRPSIMLPTVVFAWGAVVCFMALVKNYQGLYGLRICLGFAESAFYPGIVFLLGSWYTREELGARTAVFAAGSQISGAFSGIISGAIASNLDGAHGLRGWKWLFIIEGLIAVAIGLVGFFVLPDYPHNTRFITGDMRDLAVKRLERQGKMVLNSGLNWLTFRNLFTTPFIYLFIGMFICMQMGMGIISNFPIILKSLGYSASFANYMMVPIFIWVGIVVIAQGYLSDKYSRRAYHVIFGSLYTLIWYIVLVAVNGGNLPIGLLFVCAYMVVPIYGVSPIMMSWANEIYACDRESRALAIAIINTIGNLVPNFVNVRAWVVTDTPKFRLGKEVTMGMTVALVIMALLATFFEQKGLFIPQAPKRVSDEEMVSKKNDDSPEEL